jgi:uncharacterized protein with NRDE domain
MCLAVVAYHALKDWPLIIVANRDEYHARPTLAAKPWPMNPAILAGKDLVAGGSWFGATQLGQIALLTNYREPLVAQQKATSRGKLVSDFLMEPQKSLHYLQALTNQAHLYNGFNLLVGDQSGLYVASNRQVNDKKPKQHSQAGQANKNNIYDNQTHEDPINGQPYILSQDEFIRPITAGVWGLSNAFFNTPWPKLTRSRDAVKTYLQLCQKQNIAPSFQILTKIMHNTTPVPDDELPQTGLSLERERQLATPFIVGQDYGTRCTTVLMQHIDGRILFDEQSYAPGLITPNKSVNWQFLPQQPHLGWHSRQN